MGLKILFLILTICLITQPAFSDITINQTLGVGDVLDIPFTTPSGGIADFNNSVLGLGITLVPSVVSTDYLFANLFVGNSLLGSNSGILFTPPPDGELFIWRNQNSVLPWASFATSIDFSSLLNGTNQGLIQVGLASSNPVTINTVGLFYGSSTDGGFTITASPQGFTYSASVTPIPEPSTLLLISSGLVCLWGFRKRFRN